MCSLHYEGFKVRLTLKIVFQHQGFCLLRYLSINMHQLIGNQAPTAGLICIFIFLFYISFTFVLLNKVNRIKINNFSDFIIGIRISGQEDK